MRRKGYKSSYLIKDKGDRMDIFKWVESKVKKMKWYDISLVKLTVFFATLFLITAWTGFRDLVMTVAWFWYLLITLVLMLPIMKRMFLD